MTSTTPKPKRRDWRTLPSTAQPETDVTGERPDVIEAGREWVANSQKPAKTDQNREDTTQ